MGSAITPACLIAKTFGWLRDLDLEASTIVDGYPTGLCDFGRHEGSRRAEPAITRALVARLNGAGIAARSERKYPKTNQFCDVVAELVGSGPFWIEVKCAWKEYWRKKGNLSKYQHELLDTSAKDIAKLRQLPVTIACQLGFILIGFDSAEFPMDEDVERFAALTQLDKAPWISTSSNWDDPYRMGERVHCWAWWAPSRSTPDI